MVSESEQMSEQPSIKSQDKKKEKEALTHASFAFRKIIDSEKSPE